MSFAVIRKVHFKDRGRAHYLHSPTSALVCTIWLSCFQSSVCTKRCVVHRLCRTLLSSFASVLVCYALALPEGQRVGRTGTVAEALVGVLSCVTRMSAAVTKLVTLTRAVNLELSQALPEPKLIPFVTMAPVRPGFMTLERGVTALTPAMKRRLRVHVNWSATKNLTDEQVAEYERDHGDITKLRRVLSVKTDGSLLL
ncbi:hypothetical protein J8273_1110 [Carpediemonas membranifera]|uniref:Uncharacterized protein n=1 Tax=Carpediemonas membranifera TaxID=201153 RepID=A0A8J6AXD3_9EUKA|nr:hypothetical protein J8273_1110 [Carpediemonas membranifera]|eukprot:KAG9397201.1 hypothetical protein J8273_1110 [Carpediemonas membranifera]